MNQPPNVHIQAVPNNAEDLEGTYTIECDHCGILTVAEKNSIDETCIAHLAYHGVDTTPFRTQ